MLLQRGLEKSFHCSALNTERNIVYQINIEKQCLPCNIAGHLYWEDTLINAIIVVISGYFIIPAVTDIVEMSGVEQSQMGLISYRQLFCR
jgi:hypothetical protein